MKLKKFDEFESINEEFIGGLIKGALGKLMNLFAAPFKDLAKDFKDFFKEDDPNSIKTIIMNNFNQAIDTAQKEINNIQDETALNGIMVNLISTMAQLGLDIGKDIQSSGITKEKVSVVNKISQAIILGNKQVKWPGIVGILDPNNSTAIKFNGGMKTNYKYSKAAYEKALADAAQKSKEPLKTKKQAANTFFDALQKDIQLQLDKEFNEEEVKAMFNSGAADSKGFTEEELTDFMNKKTEVYYLKKGKTINDYKKQTPPDQQGNVVGKKPIHKIDNGNVIFLDIKNRPTIRKTFDQIVDVAENKELGSNAKKTQDILGRIKGDEVKMGKVAKFAEFIEKPENKAKIDEIEKMLV
jgi:hypothetical protein